MHKYEYAHDTYSHTLVDTTPFATYLIRLTGLAHLTNTRRHQTQLKTVEKTSYKPNSNSGTPSGKKSFLSRKGGKKQLQTAATSQHPQTLALTQPTKPKVLPCLLCKGKHNYITYCKQFQGASVKERYDLLKNAGVCMRTCGYV